MKELKGFFCDAIAIAIAVAIFGALVSFVVFVVKVALAACNFIWGLW